MSIIASDVKFYFSWGSGNTDPNACLWWVISTTQVTDNTINNLFDNVSWVEHTSWDTNYRCIYVVNSSAETAYNVRIFIDSNTTAIDDTINIGKDLWWLDATADTIANESTAPDPAVTFTTAADYANAIMLWDMTAWTKYWVWVKRIVSAGSTAQANDTCVLKVSVDTV